MLRVAVIGCGPIGNRHADIYVLDPLSELVGVCDILPERADAAAARLACLLRCPDDADTLAPPMSVATGGWNTAATL